MFCAVSLTAPAQITPVITYQGRLSAAGTNFTGTGQFKFAFVTHGTNMARGATATATLTNGSLAGVTVVDGGAGYTAPPVVTIGNIPGPPPGSGAIVTAQISGGAVTGFTIVNPGHGYLFAIVQIAPPPPEYFATGVWSASGSTLDGIEPALPVSVPVTDGLFTVNLGEPGTTVGMDPGIFAANSLWLRIWFSPDGSGFQRLRPDQPLTSAPYAVQAGNANEASHAVVADAAKQAEAAVDFSGELAGDVRGAQSATVVSYVGGQTAASVAGGVSAANAATSANVANSIVRRDGSGGFSAGNLTAANITASSVAGSHSGTFTGTFSGNGSGLTNLNGAHLQDNSVTSSQLAAGTAAANLNAGGQSAVASGGILLSEQPNNTSLLNAGYVQIGKLELVPEGWTNYASGPTNSGKLNMARANHSAVWTGSEMIIWGGYDGSYLDDGARYNPALNTWSTVSRTGAPLARAYHDSVWTGSQMIIWGRWSGNEYVNDGGRYNPSTDTWSSISTVNAPTGENSVTWCNGYMVAYGFIPNPDPYDPSQFFLEVRRYNPTSNTWLAGSTNGAPSPRQYHSAINTGTEVIIWGGEQYFSCGWICFWIEVYRDGARYNPVTDTWTAVGTTGSPQARCEHSAVWTGTQMLVWGGRGTNGTLTGGERYTLAGNSWSPMTLTGDPGPRNSCSVVWGGNRMIVWGGSDANDNLNTGGRYDPVANTWSSIATASAPSARRDHTAVWTGSQMVIWGGGEGDSYYTSDYLDAGGRYNVTNNTWTTMAPSPGSGEPGARQKASAVWTGSEMIVWGGEADRYYLHSGGRFDPALNTWSSLATANAPSGRIHHTAVWSGTEMLVWGGYDVGPTATGARYNPVANVWQTIATSNAPSARRQHAAVWTGNEMLIWGGAGPGALIPFYPAAGARYFPSANLWLPMSTNNVPTPRAQPAYVWTGQELIVWGGSTLSFGLPPVVNYQNSGGRYSPATDSWTATPVAGAPQARMDHRAVWTGKEMIVWGGIGGGTKLNTGARFNPSSQTWTALSTNGAPDPRSQPTAFWDGSRMIIWGGEGVSGALRSGGRFDPLMSTWTPITITGAPAQASGNAAVWTGTQMITWGGTNAVGYLDTPYGYTPPRTTYLYLRP